MTRTKICDRTLPDYTKGEEIFNMVSHIVGAAFGVIVLLVCIIYSTLYSDGWAITSSAIYGGSMILLYTMSSIYHGLKKNTGKKVLQVLDHCTIYFLIAGTYTPIVLCKIRPMFPVWGWGLFAVVWGLCIIATVLTAIDLKKYSAFSMICYIGMGWSIVFAIKPALQSVPIPALLWILAGGIAYTIGAILYGIGKRRRYMHSVFHLFVVLGSVLQFIGIIRYVL